MEHPDSFHAWEQQFSSHNLTVTEGVIQYAQELLSDIILAPQAQRKEMGEQATRLLEGRYPEQFIASRLAVVAGNALVINKLLWDEFLVDGSTVDGPIYAEGNLAGFRFIHALTTDSKYPEPVYGLQMSDAHILNMKKQPIATLDQPLLIPVHQLQPLN